MPCMDTTLANEALHLAMEWGKDWLQPTQPRMKTRHPELDDAQLDAYDKLAQEAMRYGHGLVYDSPNCERTSFADAVRAKYPWVSDENIQRLHSQGQYYAMK